MEYWLTLKSEVGQGRMASFKGNNLPHGVDDGGPSLGPEPPHRLRRKRADDHLCAEFVMSCLGATAFDIFMLGTTVWVGVVMALAGPEPTPGSTLEAVSDWTGYLITPLYSIEALLKMYGLGLWVPKNPTRLPYLKDSWCIFDLVVVMSGWVDIALEISLTGASANLLALRMVRFSRIFRLVQAMNRVQNMKIMIETLTKCVYNSRHVYLFIFIFMILYITLGLTWFSDELRFTCALVEGLEDANGNKYTLSEAELKRLADGESWGRVTSAPLMRIEPRRFCRHRSRPIHEWGRQCSEGQMCIFEDEAPFNGLFNFEHGGNALLVVFGNLLQFRWDAVMLALMDATNQASCIFFVLAALAGPLFLMQYTVSVMCLAYEQIIKERGGVLSTEENFRQGEGLLMQIGMSQAHDSAHEKPVEQAVNSIQNHGPASRSQAKADADSFVNNRSMHHSNSIRHNNGSTVESPLKGGQASTPQAKQLNATDMSGYEIRHVHGALSVDAMRDQQNGMEVKSPTKETRNDQDSVGQHDIRSYPFLSLGERNVKAWGRVRRNYAPADGGLTAVQMVGYVSHVMSFVSAGVVMYPSVPSEQFGAGGQDFFDGVDATSFYPSLWEVTVTIASVAQVMLEIQYIGVLVENRVAGLPRDKITALWEGSRPIFMDFFVPFFCVDVAIKLIAFQGPKGYFSSAINRVDFVVTFLDTLGSATWRLPNMSILRVSRWLVQLYLCRSLSSFNRVVSNVGDWLNAVYSILIVLFFIVLLAITGQQMFAGTSQSPKGIVYYQDFFSAILDVVSLVSADGVGDMMIAGMTGGVQSVVFIVMACFLLKAIVLHVMIAVMTHNFEESEIVKIQYQIFFSKTLKDPQALVWNETDHHHEVRGVFQKALLQVSTERPGDSESKSAVDVAFQKFQEQKLRQKRLMEKYKHADEIEEVGGQGLAATLMRVWKMGMGWRQRSPLIQKMKYAIEHRYFDMIISCFITLTATMSAACPPTSCSLPQETMWGFDRFVATVFTFEILVKMIVFGLIRDQEAFLRRPWNWLDLGITCVLWVETLGVPSLQGLYTLRMLRLIRVVRSIKMFPTVRTAYSGIYASIEDLFYILLSIVAVAFIFASFARQLTGGLLYSCNDPDVPGLVTCSGSYYKNAIFIDQGGVSVLMPRAWRNNDINFDGWGDAAFAISAMFLGAENLNVGRRVLEITGPGMQPDFEAGSHTLGVPFVIFYIVSAAVFWQMIISIIIKSLRHGDGSAFQTGDQKAWRSTRRVISDAYLNFAEQQHKVYCKPAQRLKDSVLFGRVINFTIFANIVIMLTDSYGRTDAQRTAIQVITTMCLCGYFVEMFTLILASPWHYFFDATCIFDCVVNMISAVDLVQMFVAHSSTENGSSVGVQALRALRVLRIFRLARGNRGITVLVISASKAIPKALGVHVIWALSTFTFALLANRSFASVKEGVIVSSITGFNTFDSLSSSILWLFRLTLNGSVSELASDLEVSEPFCTVAVETSDCGNVITSRLFLILYLLITKALLIPLTTGTLVNAFFDTIDDMRSLIDEEELGRFQSCWRYLDPKCTGYIALWKLDCLLEVLRTQNSELWFDGDREPAKKDYLITAISSSMKEQRTEILNRKTSAIADLKGGRDLGRMHGLMRFDVVLLELVAVKNLAHTIQMSNTEAFEKIESLSFSCFQSTQQLLFGDRHHRDASRVQKGNGMPADILSETINTSFGNKAALTDVNVHQNGMLRHRLFEFRHFLYAAKNPAERSAGLIVGWHPEKGARRQKGEDKIHPWIQQHLAQVQNATVYGEDLSEVQSNLSDSDRSCGPTHGSDDRTSISASRVRPDSLWEANAQVTIVHLELSGDDEVARAKGDVKKLALVAAQIAQYTELALGAGEGQISATIPAHDIVTAPGGRVACRVVVQLRHQKDESDDNLAMALVRQGKTIESDLKILLPSLIDAELQDSHPDLEKQPSAELMSGATQAQHDGQHDQDGPLNLSGIFVQVTDLIGSLLPASKTEPDHGAVPKRLVFTPVHDEVMKGKNWLEAGGSIDKHDS